MNIGMPGRDGSPFTAPPTPPSVTAPRVLKAPGEAPRHPPPGACASPMAGMAMQILDITTWKIPCLAAATEWPSL